MRYSALARAVWGTSLLLAPGQAIRAVSGETADRASKITGRILGFRHLTQALTIERAGTRGWLLAGAAIDATHALSMVGLATLSERYRRLAALDAVLAGGWAINGLREAHGA